MKEVLGQTKDFNVLICNETQSLTIQNYLKSLGFVWTDGESLPETNTDTLGVKYPWLLGVNFETGIKECYANDFHECEVYFYYETLINSVLNPPDNIEPSGFEIQKIVDESACVINKPLKSDGGSSSYYDLPLSQKTIDFIKEHGYVKTEQLILDIFDNDFDFGNSFKSLVRAKGITQGGGKAGNTVGYEMNKVVYSSNKIKDRYAEE